MADATRTEGATACVENNASNAANAYLATARAIPSASHKSTGRNHLVAQPGVARPSHRRCRIEGMYDPAAGLVGRPILAASRLSSRLGRAGKRVRGQKLPAPQGWNASRFPWPRE